MSRLFKLCYLFVIVALLATPAFAAGPTIGIDSVGGKQVVDGRVKGTFSGKVPVRGTAMPSAPAAEPAPAKPLVADAGDSGFGAVGDRIGLLGAGFGGAEPYTFAWSSPAGALEGADAPTAQLDTAGVAPGAYSVTLTVRDSAGATAIDTVKVVVYQAQRVTLLDEARLDATPGVLSAGAPGVLSFPFTVPANTTRIDVTISWTVPANDYDLRVLDPSGAKAASAGGGVPTTSETTGVASPAAGTWTVAADKFATVADTVRATVVATVGAADPRPSVRAGGPYKFAVGATQALAGQVSGGTAPLTVGWDTDLDGRLDRSGASITTNLPLGRQIVTLKATDAAGLERRETTSVTIADPARLAATTTAITVVGINDSGINPYHLEFSAQTYPDPDVLALTRNFTRHPSEYIPGYPADARALPITLGKGYFPAEDKPIWTNNTIQPGSLYWIPGTKIVGAVDAGGSTGATSGEDLHPILDDNGHGSGSASVSTGNRYGYCPTCLLVVVEALDESVVAKFSWVDISSNSFGYVGGAPLGPAVGPNVETRAAVERGQTVLFAAGNGVGNAFDVPISTYGSDQTGPDWNITVGAIRRDNQRAVVGDGIPVHISAWGDGNLPSACRTGTVSQCAFGGTSAATPYTAGVFGTVLTEVRRHLGDGAAGQKAGQVVADGFPVAASDYLKDGKLSRTELREAVLKTAFPLNQQNETSIFPYVLTAPYAGDVNVLFEGYGAATPQGARRAIDVLLGKAALPDRSFEDQFFALDRQIRDTIYGGYDRDGDGKIDYQGLDQRLGIDRAAVATPAGALAAMQKVASLAAPRVPEIALGTQNALRYYLHRVYEAEPDTVPGCTWNVQFMDQEDRAGDNDLCFDSRATSVLAAYRPVGIFPTSHDVGIPLPSGSTVFAELYMAGETPSVIRPTGVLMAGDRELGKGAAAPQPVLGTGPGGAACAALGEACWTKYTFSFDTTRPAIAGEQLTFQVQLLGARSWAFGHEGAHASRITIVAAPMPATGLQFGVSIASPAEGEKVPRGHVVVLGSASFPELGTTEAGDHPSQRRVEVSVDDPSFAAPIRATLTESGGQWSWSAPLGELAPGAHTIYARAAIDTTDSEVATRRFTVDVLAGNERVEWQVVAVGGQPAPDGWRLAGGVLGWAFEIDTPAFGRGSFRIHVRLVEGSQPTAQTFVEAKFSGR